MRLGALHSLGWFARSHSFSSYLGLIGSEGRKKSCPDKSKGRKRIEGTAEPLNSIEWLAAHAIVITFFENIRGFGNYSRKAMTTKNKLDKKRRMEKRLPNHYLTPTLRV